jgi:RimJ/RimL family protein N-acetyltransferase
MPELVTPRLRLVPVTLPTVEAVLARDRRRCEELVGARFPDDWPNDDLVARAFPYSLAAIRAAPDVRLWGDSLVLAKDEPRVIGSVVFHGRPDDGVAEVGYGIEHGSRGQGFAAEATAACVAWALGDGGIAAVQATTFPWHAASLGVIRKLGMTHVGHRHHDMLGELLVFERRAAAVTGS